MPTLSSSLLPPPFDLLEGLRCIIDGLSAMHTSHPLRSVPSFEKQKVEKKKKEEKCLENDRYFRNTPVSQAQMNLGGGHPALLSTLQDFVYCNSLGQFCPRTRISIYI